MIHLLVLSVAVLSAGVVSATVQPTETDKEERPNPTVLLADDTGSGDAKCCNPDSRIPRPSASAKPSTPVAENNPTKIPKDYERPYLQFRQGLIHRIELDIAALAASCRLLFVGDSITRQWDTALWDTSLKAPYSAINLAIGGDRIENMLFRITPAAQGGMGQMDAKELQPEVIVLMAGTNNLSKDRTVDELVAGIQHLASYLLALEPQARMILCSIPPTNAEEKNRTLVTPVNARLKAWCQAGALNRRVQFLSIYPHLIRQNGAQDPRFFKDRLHLTSQGYQVWHDLLMPELTTLLSK